MPYTMQGYIDEVVARLPRYEISVQDNIGQMEMLINRSRRDVQMAILPFMEYRFGRRVVLSASPTLDTRLNVMNGSFEIKFYALTLPNDVIDVPVVNVLTDTVWRGAAKLTKQEVYGYTSNYHTRPQPYRPVFFIEKSPTTAAGTLYVSKGTAAVTASQTEMYYVAALPHLQQVNDAGGTDSEKKIPWDCEELVILSAISKLMMADNFGRSRKTLEADIDLSVRVLEDNYKSRIDRSHLLLPTRESLIPNVPIPENMPERD